jgi:cytochrome c-type biogenesis protein CcmF
MPVANYVLRLDRVEDVTGPNYQAARAIVDVMSAGRVIATVTPEKRMYPAEGQAVSYTSIRTNGFSDLYMALGDERGDGRWTLRAYVNPLAPFIWFGGMFMALGGFASLWSRLRLKIVNQAIAAAPAE